MTWADAALRSEGDAGASRLRLWRVRHRQDAIDAETTTLVNGATELRLLYNGRPVYRRTWPHRDDAVTEAAARRAVLERAGWTRHW